MSDDETFLMELETCSLPLSEFHHREHVKLAYLYLRQHPFKDALKRIRETIVRYNGAHDLQDSPTTGYHETITYAWLRLIEFVIDEYGPSESADEFYESHPELSQTKTLRLFYSRQRMMSPDAKATAFEPDLAAFPICRQ